MRRILVANSKGGCGKTTVATNLASLYAARGLRTALYDYDPQGSSTCWLEARPPDQARIHGVAAYRGSSMGLTRSWQMRLPPDTERLIIDTPAGLDKPQLLEQVRTVDTILIPLVPSAIDLRAAAGFIRDLLQANRGTKARVGIIANRVKNNSPGLESLESLLETLQLPLVARLRDTQHYLTAADQGLGLHELDLHRVRFDLPHWQRLLDWTEGTASTTPRSVATAQTQLLHA